MDPALSIIVCTYNREKYIGKCLDHLLNQTADKSLYEVIIVNNNSTDGTDKICRDFISNNKAGNFLYVIELNQGHSHSRNRGIIESKAELINFIDDDAFVYPDFAKNIIHFFKSNEHVNAIGGKIQPVFEEKVPAWMSSYLMPLVSALDMGNKIKTFAGRKFPIGANMTFRKSIFFKYGMFNTNLGRKGDGLEGGDEKEIFMRLKAEKEIMYYVPMVKVDHIIPQHRTELAYIKGLAIGVGTSERKRITGMGMSEIIKKMGDELLKSMATVVLFFLFLLMGKISKGWILIKFRFWVQRGLIFNR